MGRGEVRLLIGMDLIKLERQRLVLSIMRDLRPCVGIELMVREKGCFFITRGRSKNRKNRSCAASYLNN